MNEKEIPAKTRAQFLRDAFEGMKGRQPISDDELDQWLATDEGKAATILMTRLCRRGATEGDPNNAATNCEDWRSPIALVFVIAVAQSDLTWNTVEGRTINCSHWLVAFRTTRQGLLIFRQHPALPTLRHLAIFRYRARFSGGGLV